MKLPEEFLNRMKEYLGDEYEAFLASYDEPEVKGLRLNTLAPGDNLGAICNWMDKFGELAGTELGSEELAGTEPGSENLAETESGYEALAGTEPGSENLAETESGCEALAGTESGSEDLAGFVGDGPWSATKDFRLERVPWCEDGYIYYNYLDHLVDSEAKKYLACEAASDGTILGDKINLADERIKKKIEAIPSLRPGKHPYHEAGAYYIQEPSAMSPVTYLDVNPGDRVLDLCAAPGGKSTQLAAALKGEGILITNEIMPDRARILSENIERMGVKNALVISEDPRNISDRFAGFFDKVLVDAPCSGEGMFRRSETAVNEWSLDNVQLCANRQTWILDEAIKMLAPGGCLVYSTCTFSKEEDEEQIKALLERNSEVVLEDMKVFSGMTKGYDDIGIRIFPHKTKGEGHYICKLKKKAADESFLAKISISFEPDLSKKDREQLKDMFSLFDEILGKESEFISYLSKRRITRFKDQIYLLPSDCPLLKGLKVLRPGLHLGTILKNRFEPGHALAMALYPEEVKNKCQISAKDDRIYKYFAGETFNLDESEAKYSGWNVVFADNYSVGWGKISNNLVKNHYPKGLRKNLR